MVFIRRSWIVLFVRTGIVGFGIVRGILLRPSGGSQVAAGRLSVLLSQLSGWSEEDALATTHKAYPMSLHTWQHIIGMTGCIQLRHSM